MKHAALVIVAVLFTAAWTFAGEVPLIADPVVAPASGTVNYQRQGDQTRAQYQSDRPEAREPIEALRA